MIYLAASHMTSFILEEPVMFTIIALAVSGTVGALALLYQLYFGEE